MANSTRLVRLRYQGVDKTVALYPGLDADELNKLLKTVFSLSSSHSVVGIQTEVQQNCIHGISLHIAPLIPTFTYIYLYINIYTLIRTNIHI